MTLLVLCTVSDVGFVLCCVVGLSTFYTELMRGLGASTRVWQLIDSQPSIPLTGLAGSVVTQSLLHKLIGIIEKC